MGNRLLLFNQLGLHLLYLGSTIINSTLEGRMLNYGYLTYFLTVTDLPSNSVCEPDEEIQFVV